MDALLNWIPEYGYPALFLLLMLGIVGLPIPDETLLTFSGYLIFKNQLLWMPTMATAFFGSICGITISYLIGRRLGLFVVRTVGHRLRVAERAGLEIFQCDFLHAAKTSNPSLSTGENVTYGSTVLYRRLSQSIPPEYPPAFHSAFSGQSLTLPLRFFTP
jgi:hypothetical protein